MNKVMYVPMQYEDGEKGRLEEVLLYHILETLSPDWAVTYETGDFIRGMVAFYNAANNNTIDYDVIDETVQKIKRMKYRPTRKELLHVYNMLGFSQNKTKHQLGTTVKTLNKALDMDDPCEDRKTPYKEDVYEFNRFIYRNFRHFVERFSSWIKIIDMIPKKKWEVNKKKREEIGMIPKNERTERQQRFIERYDAGEVNI